MRKILLVAALMIAGFSPVVTPIAHAASPIPSEPDTERRTRYTLTAQTGPFSVGFDLYGDGSDYQNWIRVFLNGVEVTQSGNWTLSSASGTLSTLPRPITDATITFAVAQTGTLDIVGARRPRRTSQFTENRGVTARDLNQVLTDLWMTGRERWDYAPRTMLGPPGETIGPLPSAAARANALLAFDASGNPVATAPGGFVVGPTGNVTHHTPVFGANGSILIDGGVGTSGQVWTSNGASADPTFQTPAALANVNANTMMGNWSGSSAPASAQAMPSCSSSSSFLQYTTSTGVTCGTVSGSGTVNSGTAGQLSYYATSTTAVSSNDSVAMSSQNLQVGKSGSAGSLSLYNGSTTHKATISATSSTTDRAFTLPDAAGTFALTANNLSAFASTTSSQLAGVISDETGSGSAVFGTSPTLTTPTLGVAIATSINKVAITAPASSATLVIPDGVTMTGPASSATVAGVGIANTFTGANSFSGVTTFTGTLIVPTRVVTASGAITVSATTDYLICVNKTATQATSVNLPASPATGQTYLIKDCKGDAGTNNVTIIPNSGNIDGSATFVLAINRGSVAVTYSGSEWVVN